MNRVMKISSRALRGLLPYALMAFSLSACLIGPEQASCATSSCDQCIQRSGCGWCPGRGCVEGNSTGPNSIYDYCEDDYRWNECTIEVDPCSVHIAQDRCELASGCHYCPGLGCRRLASRCTIPDAGAPTCLNTCRYAYDDACDDGSNGGVVYCEVGTDCADCGSL